MISIIAIISTIAIVSLGPARVNARNNTRKANLVQISKALEAYNIDNGAYPSTGGLWHGACNDYGPFLDSGAGAWIPNFGSYMTLLPHDPNTNKVNSSSAAPTCRSIGTNNCYLYNSNGTDYKLLAHCIPEGAMLSTDPFYDPNRPTWAWQVSSSGGAGW